MLQVAAYSGVFSDPVLCSFARSEKWFSAGTPGLDSSLYNEFCLEQDQRIPDAVCECDQTSATLAFVPINTQLVNAAVSSNSSICDSVETAIYSVFGKLRGCDYTDKLDQLSKLTAFKTLCGRDLSMDAMICPTACSADICENQIDVCGNLTQCLAQTTAGCDSKYLLERVVFLQEERNEYCNLTDAESIITLTNQPGLNGILECMGPMVRGLAGNKSMPVGRYCNGLSAMSQCMDDLGEDAEDETIQKLMTESARTVFSMINTEVCDFMPDTECGEGLKADVVILVDDSGSVGQSNYNSLLVFLDALLSEWDIGQDKIRVGLMRFSDIMYIEFHLNRYDDKEDMLEAVRNLDYEEGLTFTDVAIRDMTRKMFTAARGDRPTVPNFGIVFTDGKSRNRAWTLAAATEAKNQGITLLPVGVGGGVDMDELADIASSPETLFSVRNFQGLVEFQSAFQTQACKLISDLLLPYTPSEGPQCEALKREMTRLEKSFLQLVRLPFYSAVGQREICSFTALDEVEDLSACGEEERKYILGRAMAYNISLQEFCLRQEPEPGCDLQAASTCLLELATAFVQPALSPCAQYSRAEVCVMRHTKHCSSVAAMKFTHTMSLWKQWAESTCCQGHCDPAKAVLCFLDLQNKVKSPVPDWEGICSMVQKSRECADRNMIGCNHCQKDTLETIKGKITIPLEVTCRDPPINNCRALAAMKCKDPLLELKFNPNITGLLCLKVFEARKCVHDLTWECDDATKLAVSVDLERVVIDVSGQSCDGDLLLPACYPILVDRVNTILAFDPFDPSDPAYKYKPDSQDMDGRYNGTCTGNKSDKKNCKGSTKNSHGKTSGDDSSIVKHVQEVEFPFTYLGKMCREAQLAYLCVASGLEEFPPSAVLGLADVLYTTWKLAWLRCEDIVEPLSCFVCNESSTNELCNANGPEECPDDFQMCETVVRQDNQGMVVGVEKSCVVPHQCRPGCKGNECTFCCDSQDCNEPDNGPLTGACDLQKVSGCLSEMSSVFLTTDTINCSFVEDKKACITFTQDQCEWNGRQEVSRTLSGFLRSRTVSQCQLNLTDSRCGLYAVSAVASSFITYPTFDIDHCPMLALIDQELKSTQAGQECTPEEITAVTESYELLHTQLCLPYPQCASMSVFFYCVLNAWDLCSVVTKMGCFASGQTYCHPALQFFSTLAANATANIFCSNFSLISKLPGLLQPLGECVLNFTVAFDASKRETMALYWPVYELVLCLLDSWDVSTVRTLPPTHKIYVKDILLFLEDVLLPAVAPEDGDTDIQVSANCNAALSQQSMYLENYVLLFMFRTLNSVEVFDFCRLSSIHEGRLTSSLDECTDEENRYQLRLLTTLQAYRQTLCPVDQDSLPKCSQDSANQCLTGFSAIMDSTEDTDLVCSALETTLECVNSHASNCTAMQAKAIHWAVYDVVSSYQALCPDVVAEALCAGTSNSGVTDDCQAVPAALDLCDSKPVTLTRSSIQEALDCYKQEIGNCTNQVTYQNRFKLAFPVHYQLATNLFGLNLTTWAMSEEGNTGQCLPAVCDAVAAAACLVTSDFTASTITQAPTMIAEASQCMIGNLTGCDFVMRMHVIYKAQRQIDALTVVFPTMSSVVLTQLVTFNDPFNHMMIMGVTYLQRLDRALYQPDWHLLPLCWWLYDLGNELKVFISDRSFRATLFQRSSQRLESVMNGVCSDPDFLGEKLSLTDIDTEPDSCPAREFLKTAGVTIYEAVFTAVLHAKTRSHLCSQLDNVTSLDMSSCSKGRQHQMKLLTSAMVHLSGNVCGSARYCNASQVQVCVNETMQTVYGVGVNTTIQQVCSSVQTLDRCVSRFSHHCDSISMMRIKRAVKTVRHLAVTVCGEDTSGAHLPTCTLPAPDTCQVNTALTCSFTQLHDLLSVFGDRRSRCRVLQDTEACYSRVTETCSAANASFVLRARLPAAGLTSLQSEWQCENEAEVCRDRCQLKEAEECVKTLRQALRDILPSYDNRWSGDTCRLVTTARTCLIETVGDCEYSEQSRYHKEIDSVMSLYPSLTDHCEDVYSCLDEFIAFSRQILSKDDISQPESNRNASDSQAMGSANNSTSSSRERGPWDFAEGSSLVYLCQRAHRSWQCAERGVRKLPSLQRDFLSQIFSPLWSVISQRCADSVPLECYTCSNVTYDTSEVDCTEYSRACGHNERCFSQYETVWGEVYVSRGCMKPTSCDMETGDNLVVKCCDSDLCNTNADINNPPGVDSMCYLEFAVDCGFSFAETLVMRGAVDCSSSLANLQCVSKYSEYCPAAQSLYQAANGLMLTLAQTTCVQGELSDNCSSIAVSSMEAILSNAYSMDSACSGLRQSSASVDLQEKSGVCTAMDLVALRESLSYAKVVTFETCNPDDCQPIPSPTTKHRDREDCDYRGTYTCGYLALTIFSNPTYDPNTTCSATSAYARCAALDLEGCETPAFLQGMVDAVKDTVMTNCGTNFTTPTTATDPTDCTPSITCDMEAALMCVDLLLTSNDTDVCRQLEEAAECREENMVSCRSMQSSLTAIYFTSTLGPIIDTCKDNVTLDLTLPTDVYAGAAACVGALLDQVEAAMQSSSFMEPMCAALQEWNACPKNLPYLQTSQLNRTLELFNTIEPLCNVTATTPVTKRKRAASCSLEDRGSAITIINMANFFSIFPLTSRPGLCVRLKTKGLDVLAYHLSSACSSVGLTDVERSVLMIYLEFGWKQFDNYCVEVLYTPDSCRPDLFSACMAPFTTMASLSKTEDGTLCRTTESAMTCLRKFSADCASPIQPFVDKVWEQVRASVGHTCPNLTLGLHCPQAYPALINPMPCDQDLALDCLPEDSDLGALQALKASYCSDLETGLQCAADHVEGCLPSQVQTVQTAVNNVNGLQNEMSDCSIAATLTDYSSACKAAKPCSLLAAFACFDLEEGDNMTDCGFLNGVRSCMDTAVGSCDVESTDIVHELFLLRFQSAAPVNCQAPFSGLPGSASSSYQCFSYFLSNFSLAVENERTVAAVCDVLSEFKSCVMSANITSMFLTDVFDPQLSYIDDTIGLFCQPGGTNASTAVVSSDCDLPSATFCLSRELSWAVNRYLLPNEDNLKFCQQWHWQETRTCVSTATDKCDNSIHMVYETVVDMVNRLVLSSRVCDSLHVCLLPEAFFHINQLSVAISTYTMDNDVPTLCLKKQQTEASVMSFTSTCTGAEKLRVATSLARVTSLVAGICEDVVLPPPPVCPEIPSEQQSCSIGGAFTCLIDFNKAFFNQDYFQTIGVSRSWCRSLENTFRCAALNTSGCDSTDKDLQTVLTQLQELRDSVDDRCPWLSRDLCTRSAPCPVQTAGCDVALQVKLINNPLADVCLFIEEAHSCVAQNTITCTPAQKKVAGETIRRRLEDMSIPDLTCDGTEVAPCLLLGKAAARQVLMTPSGGNTTSACDAMIKAGQCLTDRVAAMALGPSQQLSAAQILFSDLQTAIAGWCSNPGQCGDIKSQVMSSVFDLVIALATATTLDPPTFCSARQAVLAEIEEIVTLHPTCSFSEFDSVAERLAVGFPVTCQVSQQADCVTANATAHACIDAFNATHDVCSGLNSLVVCVAPALGICGASTALNIQTTVEQFIDNADTCLRPPLLALSTSASDPLYLSEKGGTQEIQFEFVEAYGTYAGAIDREIVVRAQVTNHEPPACLGEDSQEISQLSVVFDDQPCGTRVKLVKWNSKHTVRLIANQDGRQDGMQTATVALYADLFDFSSSTNQWLLVNQSYKLIEYEVKIEDSDIDAVCSSVGPHTSTFDNTVFNNHQAGEFVLYRNTYMATAVTVSMQQCTLAAGTCTCAVDVYAGSTQVRFDRCRRINAIGQPANIEVSLIAAGSQDDLSVFRHKTLNTYFVVLPTGTIVTVKNSNSFVGVWLSASSFDFGKTEGLCGVFDDNAYNDLTLPDGTRYLLQTGDLQYGVLSPSGFISDWMVSSLNSTVISEQASSILTRSCACVDSIPQTQQCSAISKVAACDYVQGDDVTELLFLAGTSTSRRRRRSTDDEIDYTVNTGQDLGWPTASNWTEEQAREHCETLLEATKPLSYCDRAVLSANGTYNDDDLIATCMDNIRLSDSTLNGNFTTSQAIEKCRSLFLRNSTYQNIDAVRPAVLLFLDHTCDQDCNDNGDCVMGECECYPGFVGGNCSYQRTDLPRPHSTAVTENGLCEVGAGSQCRDIFITGQGFIDSAYLSCHVQTVQVMSTGFNSPVGLPTKVPATLMTATKVHCRITRSDLAQQTLLVAVSNDGINPAASMLFTAYDARCYACHPQTHQCDRIVMTTCEINGQCYMPQEQSVNDTCLFCDPLQSSTDWTVRDLRECDSRRNNQTDDDDDSDDDVEISVLLIAIIAVGVVLIIAGVIVAAICVVKRRQLSARDQERYPPPPSYYNSGYISHEAMSSSRGIEPQEYFNKGGLPTRTIPHEANTIPSMSESVSERY